MHCFCFGNIATFPCLILDGQQKRLVSSEIKLPASLRLIILGIVEIGLNSELAASWLAARTTERFGLHRA